VISDLLSSDGVPAGLEALRRRGHDVVVLQLLAEEEIEPPLEGALNLVDGEDGSELKVTVDSELRALYQQQLARFLDDFEHYCRSRNIDYLRASNAIAFEDVVLKYLRQGTYLR
jgi:hypothetical protein